MFPGFKRILILPVLAMYGVFLLWTAIGCAYGQRTLLCDEYREHEPTYEQCRRWVDRDHRVPVPPHPMPVPR